MLIKGEITAMKIQLLLDNPGDVRSGFLNLDPFADDSDCRVKGDVSNLDEFVDDAEASEIVAFDILDYFTAKDVNIVLGNWVAKLAKGGKLTIAVVDLREVARGILDGKLNLDDANELLHGKQEKQWQFKKCSFTLSQLVEVFVKLGYKILSKRVQNYRLVIMTQRIL
jgi:hypothetical protein